MIIEVKDLDYQVDGRQILHQLNLGVAKGDYLTIAGPSGSGKSTLLKLLAGFLTPSAGTIEFQGRAQESYPIPAYRQQVSYCIQQPLLFGRTVQDNLAFPYAITNQPVDTARINHLLKAVDLPPRYVEKGITELSGGERQRVALVRNLLLEPAVLLLDEVTTGSDEASKQIVLHLLETEHQRGKTLIKVTHDAEEIEAAGHLLHMKGGQLINEQ